MIDVKELVEIHKVLMEVSVKGESVGWLADGIRALAAVINKELKEQEEEEQS